MSMFLPYFFFPSPYTSVQFYAWSRELNTYCRDLRTALTSLSTLSTNTTRRLDYTYYSLLSSLSSLTSTITDLHTLFASTTALHQHFSVSSSELVADTTTQISAWNTNFDTQARRIEDLEARMRAGRERVGQLGERLDRARGKVEASDARDGEGRRRVGRRLRMMWGVLGCLGGLLVVLLVMRHLVGVDVSGGRVVRLEEGTLDGVGETLGGLATKVRVGGRGPNTKTEDRGSTTRSKSEGSRSRDRGSGLTSPVIDEEYFLRLFDEL